MRSVSEPVPPHAARLGARACALVLASLTVTSLLAATPCTAQTPVASADLSATKIADARQRIANSQFPEAEQRLREAIALKPNAAEAHFLLGYVLFRELRARDSLAEYTAGAQLRSPTTEELTTVASDYILLKDLPDAEKWLLYAAQHDPLNATVWYLLGRTQYNQDRAADAARSFERSLALRPRDLRSEYNLGLAYEKLQRPADALAAYQTAIQWQSGSPQQDPQPYLDLGILLLSQAKPSEALGPLSQAVHFGPQNAFSQQELGLTFEALGRYEDAILALKQAAALAPAAEQPHFFLGRIFRHLGRTAEAQAEYAEVSRILGAHSDTATPNSDQQP